MRLQQQEVQVQADGGERGEGMCERTVGKGSAGCAVMRDYDSIERRIVLLLQLMFSDRTKGA